jgi:hypothetical protein
LLLVLVLPAMLVPLLLVPVLLLQPAKISTSAAASVTNTGRGDRLPADDLFIPPAGSPIRILIVRFTVLLFDSSADVTGWVCAGRAVGARHMHRACAGWIRTPASPP